MKFFTATTLLAAALVSAVLCIPFMPALQDHWSPLVLQVQLKTNGRGHVQLYYDSGGGFAENDSVRRELHPGAAVGTYDLPVPLGDFGQLRFDPIDGDAPVNVQSLRIVALDGRVMRTIPLSELRPLHDIDRVTAREDGVEIVPTHRTTDPQMLLSFAPPLHLAADLRSVVVPGWWHVAVVFAVMAVGLFALDRSRSLVAIGTNRVRSWWQKPHRLVLGLAALAVIISSFPVVFLGRSFVSPNIGTVLLYDEYPTLPGYSSMELSNPMGSDVGAVMWQHVPLSMVVSHALRHGEMPWWNRYSSAGTPLLGQGQSMFGDPLHFLVIAAKGAAWAWDLKYLIAKWLFAAGLGLIVLRVGRSQQVAASEPATAIAGGAITAAAAIVAATAPFVGFFIYRLNHPAFFSMCYAPWALLCWIGAVEARDLRSTAGWAGGLVLANFALMNSGTAKEAYMLLLTMNLAGLSVLATAGIAWRSRLQKLALLAWAGVVFALISAPIWDTFLHDLHSAYTSYNAVSAFQIQPTLLLGLFDEAFYRPLMPNHWTFSPSLNFVLMLGFLYFVATLRSQFAHRMAMTLAIVSLLPLALAFGLIPADWIVRVPLLGNVAHIDNTFSCALIILWSVLAGVGFAKAAARLGTREGRDDLIVVALLVGALVFAWIAFRQVVHRPIFGPVFTVNQPGHVLPVPSFIWGYLASLLIACVVLMIVVRRALVRRQLTPALVLLLTTAVMTLCWRFGQQTAAIGFSNYLFKPAVRTSFRARSDAVTFLQHQNQQEPTRAYGLHNNLFPGWTAAYGIETIHGPDALMSPVYRELVGAMGGIERVWDWRLYLDPKDAAAARPFLDSLNVRYYLDLRSDRGLLERGLRFVKFGDLDIYESPTVWPRAFFTDRVYTYDTVKELTTRIGNGDGRPFAAVQRTDLASNPEFGALSGRASGGAVEPATHYQVTENTTRFQVHASGPGAIVLLEAWWPGNFRAFVNGQKVPVQRLNHAFKGVLIDAAGDYDVEFRCVPKHAYRDLAMGGLGFVLLAGSGLVLVRRRRSE
jgi:hypothetical protein